jgi:hypothetical protein
MFLLVNRDAIGEIEAAKKVFCVERGAMISRLIVLFLLLAVACLAVPTDDSVPSNSQIEKWWKLENRERPDEELEINDVQPVRMKSGEKAFVASVHFPTRNHCCGYGILLVRPSLQEARQTHELMSVSKVIDLDYDRIDEVVMGGGFTGQGQHAESKAIVYFDGWDPVVLYERGFGDNLGACGRSDYERSCYSEEVTWVFTDLDGDHIRDLVELIVYREGKEPEQLSWTTKVNGYLFKDKKFVPASPTLTEPDRSE